MVKREQTYLFGDSVDASLHFNVLECVRDLVACVGRSASIYAEIDAMRAELDTFVLGREELIHELVNFSSAAVNDLGVLAETARRPEMCEYGAAVSRLVDDALERAQSVHRRACEDERVRVESDVTDRFALMRRQLARYFEHGNFPMEACAVSLELAPEQVKAHIRSEIAPGVSVEFETDARRCGFTGPRRLSDFVPELELEVGLKRRWFRRRPEPERVKLRDHVIVGLRARDDAVQIELTKKLGSPAPHIFVSLQEGPRGVTGLCWRAGKEDAARPTGPAEAAIVQVLWSRLQAELDELWYARRVRTMRLDDAELDDPDRAVALLERLVVQLRPVVRDLVAHSPCSDELSLKLDHGPERRIELYIKRSELTRHFVGLPAPLLLRLGFVELLPRGALKTGAALSVLATASPQDGSIPLAKIRRRGATTDRYRSVGDLTSTG